MANAMEVLSGLIAGMPEQSRLIFTHIVLMLRQASNDLNMHVQDNVSDLQRVEAQITSYIHN